MPFFADIPDMIRLAPFFAVVLLFLGSAPAFAQLDPALNRAPQLESGDGNVSYAARSGGEADLVWQWDNDPRWMRGRDHDAEVFFESIDRGRYFRGSTIGPDGDVPIEIVLSTEETTLAQTFRADMSWGPVGVGTFPGAVYDISDPDTPRRLNVVISEDDREQTANMTWDPSSAENGGREYVWIMASDYDGTGLTYAEVDNIATDADGLDILYVWEGRVEPNRSFFETDPASLSILLAEIRDFTAEAGNGEVTLSWNYDAPPEANGIVIYQGTDSPAAEALAILDPSVTSYTVEVLDPSAQFYFRAEALDEDGNVIDVSVEVQSFPITSLNMILIGTLDPADRYGDIWGYVDPATNREYALLCARDDGLYVIDVTENQPVAVGFVPDGRDSKDVKTYGQYAYLVNEYAPIQIIDLSDPTDPQVVGSLDTGGSDGGSHNILVDGDYLYVVGGRSPGGLRIYSLTDPENPTFVGGIAGTDGETYYHDVDIVGDVLYAAAIYDQGVDILDISDKANPTVTSNFQYAASSYQGAHNICSTADGNYVFVGDEIGSEPHTRAFDVRDPQNVEQVADIIVTPGQPVHNCYVKEDLLYIAHYADGVRVFDVTDPEEPVVAAVYDTFLGSQTGYVGNWTVYPYLPSGKLLASDMQSGLFVMRLDDGTVDAEDDAAPTGTFALGVSYPNPTTGTTTVPFSLREAAHVRLTVYDVLGREVAVLADEPMEAGDHTVLFDGSNLPNGAYFTRLDVVGSAQTRPLTLLR